MSRLPAWSAPRQAAMSTSASRRIRASLSVEHRVEVRADSFSFQTRGKIEAEGEFRGALQIKVQNDLGARPNPLRRRDGPLGVLQEPMQVVQRTREQLGVNRLFAFEEGVDRTRGANPPRPRSCASRPRRAPVQQKPGQLPPRCAHAWRRESHHPSFPVVDFPSLVTSFPKCNTVMYHWASALGVVRFVLSHQRGTCRNTNVAKVFAVRTSTWHCEHQAFAEHQPGTAEHQRGTDFQRGHQRGTDFQRGHQRGTDFRGRLVIADREVGWR